MRRTPSIRSFHSQALGLALALALGAATSARGQALSGFVTADGKSPFSSAFLADIQAAEKADQGQGDCHQPATCRTGSVDPLLKLLDTYTKPEEKAELEMQLGLVYNQRTGLVDPAKAVAHFTAALKYNLPERARLQALGWRANSLLALKQYESALMDNLRILLDLSYHDLSGGTPKIQGSPVPVYAGYGASSDSTNVQRLDDYNRYRQAIDAQRMFLLDRYAAINWIRDTQSRLAISEDQILKRLQELSPDESRQAIIVQWLKSDNPFPR